MDIRTTTVLAAIVHTAKESCGVRVIQCVNPCHDRDGYRQMYLFMAIGLSLHRRNTQFQSGCAGDNMNRRGRINIRENEIVKLGTS
jgi:hypothetical protein